MVRPSRSSAARAHSASASTGRHSGAGTPRAKEMVATQPRLAAAADADPVGQAGHAGRERHPVELDELAVRPGEAERAVRHARPDLVELLCRTARRVVADRGADQLVAGEADELARGLVDGDVVPLFVPD